MKNLAYLMKTLQFFAATGFITTNTALAQENNSARLMVEMVAEQYVSANIITAPDSEVMITARNIDERVHIPACPVEMQAESTPESLKQANVTVKVFCPSNQWYHYLSVQVLETQDVVILRDNLAPGTLITKDLLETTKMDRKRLRGGTFADIEDVVGARVKRRARAGNPLTQKSVCFVCKGDAIVITASTGGLEIKTTGIAQEDGNIGDYILVKNRKSKKMVSAQVTTVKEVEVQI